MKLKRGRFPRETGRFERHLDFSISHKRWRDSAALGYNTTLLNEGTPEEIEISDVNSPIMGPDSLLYDAFFSYRPNWKFHRKGTITFQLNIRNLFNEERIVPIKASSDGVYRVFMYKEPRTFSFTTRFTF